MPATPPATGAAAATRAAAPEAPVAAPAPRASSATASGLPPLVLPAAVRASEPAARRAWYRRVPFRYAALALAGLVTVGGAVAYGVRAYTDGVRPAPAPARPSPPPPERAAAVRPAGVTVAVLNGTTVDGLARRFGAQVEREGFVLAGTATAHDQARAESTVAWTDGSRAEARMVARRLGISQIERADTASRNLAGQADVIVVLGADRTQSAAGG
jgi:hypothetical protein